MKLNIFSPASPLFPFRWIAVVLAVLLSVMIWYDVSGGAMFSGNGQKEWSSRGAGYHK
jgi:hypothetical protein